MNELLEVLRFQAPKFGAELAQTAYKRGLAVTAPDGTTRPIPITATPVILDAAEIRRRSELAAQLSSATLKMADAVLNGGTRDVLLGALSPLERSIAERTWPQVYRLATTRVDFFVDSATGRARWRSTPPFPRCRATRTSRRSTFLEVVARHFGYPERAIHALLTLNGSNALALYRALLDGYAAERKGKVPDTIALLCRRNDAQITELRYLAERFREFGADADVVHPDEVSGDDAFIANGKQYDLVYRHLFVRRLEQTPSPWLEDFFGDGAGQEGRVPQPAHLADGGEDDVRPALAGRGGAGAGRGRGPERRRAGGHPRLGTLDAALPEGPRHGPGRRAAGRSGRRGGRRAQALRAQARVGLRRQGRVHRPLRGQRALQRASAGALRGAPVLGGAVRARRHGHHRRRLRGAGGRRDAARGSLRVHGDRARCPPRSTWTTRRMPRWG